MNDDLVKRLRSKTPNMTLGHNTMEEAADRIEELEAEIAKLKYSKRYWLGEYDVVLAGRADANDRIEELEAKLAEAADVIEWFINNDETNEGDEPMPDRGNRSWNEINAYWIDGLNRGRSLLAGLQQYLKGK